MLEILIGAAVIGGAGLLLFKSQIGILLRGFWGLFVKDMASTPEGAAAVYDQLIDKAQNEYNSADESVRRIAGQLETAKRNHTLHASQLQNIESKGEALARNQRVEELQILAAERAGIISQLAVFKEAVDRYEPMLAEALQIKEKMEQRLRDLKTNKVNKINQLKLDKTTQELYNNLDDLKRTSNLDKLAGAVEDKMNSEREKAIGARVVYDSKLSTKVDKANNVASKLQNDAWVDSLTQKHQTRKVTQVNDQNQTK